MNRGHLGFPTPTDVTQAELDALQAEVDADEAALAAHLANATDAHDASAISILDSGGYFTATEVEAALAEIAAKRDATHLNGWFQDNVAASQTAVVLNRANSRTEVPMILPGSVIGIVVFSNEARTAGTLTVDATVNGTVTGLTAVLDGTNTTTKVTTQALGLDTFTAGQRVGVKITTDAGWLPTTADIDVAVLVALTR